MEHEAAKTFLADLFQVAYQSADPMQRVAPFLPPRPKGKMIIIGAGKASARMAEAVEAHYGPCAGYVGTRYGYERPTKGIEILSAAHPVPDDAGVLAAQQIFNAVRGLSADDMVIALISGGGSSLLCAPVYGVSLDDKMALTQQLLDSGAAIDEINTVRKTLSLIKGGKLAQACAPATVVNLLISDVPGDDPEFIASGPTVPSRITARQAMDILAKWDIKLPDHIRQIVDSYVCPDLDPTRISTHIIASPMLSLKAVAAIATTCDVRILGDAIEGEARDVARDHVAQAIAIQEQRPKRPVLLLSGGECTVTRRGNGIGGPNAEYTLAAALALNGRAGIHVLACDTDGVDGAAEVAGAYAGPNTLSRAQALHVSAQQALADNDAHRFFAALDDQIITGPTLTNVNDFRAILIDGDSPRRDDREGG